MNKDIWISCIEVEQVNNLVNHDIRNGAFVNGLTLASNKEEAQLKLRTELNKMGFEVIKFDVTELWTERLSKGNPDEFLIEVANYVSSSGGIEFGKFNCW